MDDRLAAQLPRRGTHLREVPAEGQSRMPRSRYSMPERRFRQGLSWQAPWTCLWRQLAKIVVAQESYEISEPSIDSHIVKLKASGSRRARRSIATPKFGAQTSQEGGRDRVEADADHDQRRDRRLAAVMKPAGFENSEGVLSAGLSKDGADPQWDNDAGMKKCIAFARQVYARRQQDRRQPCLRFWRRADARNRRFRCAAMI